MLAVVLALTAAIGYGGSDFAADLASRSAPVIQITLLASVIGGVIVAAALPFAASPGPNAAGLAWGFVAGLGGTLGAFALYLGFRNAAYSVTAPLSAVASAGRVRAAGCGRWPRRRRARWRPRWWRRQPCTASCCAAARRGCWR